MEGGQKDTDKKSKKNLALLTEYDGSVFSGWQYQDNAKTVQDTIQEAWYALMKEKINLTASSRTDAGVSARGHVSNFYTTATIPAERVPLALNSVLPESVSILAAQQVATDFHAGYASKGKKYSYRFWLDPIRPTLQRHLLAHVPRMPNLELMHQALPFLEGKKDFACMMDQGSAVRSTIRTIHKLELEQEHKLLTLTVEGDGFLYHMVRIIAGTLLYIGQEKLTIEDLAVAFAHRDRTLLGKTMPPQGLCLEEVYYKPPIFAKTHRRSTGGGLL